MNDFVKIINKDISIGSKIWANDTLRWLIDFLKEDSWKDRPHYKIIVAKVVAEDLRIHCFPWQSRRVLNHLHLWLKKQKVDVAVKVSCRVEDPDPPRQGGGGHS